LRIGYAEPPPHPLHDGIGRALDAAAVEIGLDWQHFRDAGRESAFDAVLLMADPRDYRWLTQKRAQSRRILWTGENLPRSRPGLRQRLLRALPSPSLVDAVDSTAGRLVGPSGRRRMALWREEAAAERELGRNIRELRGVRGKVQQVVVTSENRRAGARLAGFDARTVPLGYHEAWCGPIVPPDAGRRDIDVLFIGRDVTGHNRRARLLAELAGQSVRPLIVDRDLYGEERSALVARARIVLDLFRVPGNATGFRFLIATAGGAALVAEECGDTWAGGMDACMAEVPQQKLARTVQALLADEERRRTLVTAGQALLHNELSMAHALQRVIDTAD
jgi:hypothetical protein